MPLSDEIRAVRHSHDTPTGTYVDGCSRCDAEKELEFRKTSRGMGDGVCALCGHPSEHQFSHKEMSCRECDHLVERGFRPGPCAGYEGRAAWRSSSDPALGK